MKYIDAINEIIESEGKLSGHRKNKLIKKLKTKGFGEKMAHVAYAFLAGKKRALRNVNRRAKELGTVFDDGVNPPKYWLATRTEYVSLTYSPKSKYSLGYNMTDAFKDHRDIIIRALKYNCPMSSRVLADYGWLVGYNNDPITPIG